MDIIGRAFAEAELTRLFKLDVECYHLKELEAACCIQSSETINEIVRQWNIKIITRYSE